jgi:hypothetical protein
MTTPRTLPGIELKATREPKTSLYGWVDSFTVHILRHSESTAKPLTKRNKGIVALNVLYLIPFYYRMDIIQYGTVVNCYVVLFSSTMYALAA